MKKGDRVPIEFQAHYSGQGRMEYKDYKGYKIFKDGFKQIRFYSIAEKEQTPWIDYEFTSSVKEAKKRIDELTRR